MFQHRSRFGTVFGSSCPVLIRKSRLDPCLRQPWCATNVEFARFGWDTSGPLSTSKCSGSRRSCGPGGRRVAALGGGGRATARQMNARRGRQNFLRRKARITERNVSNGKQSFQMLQDVTGQWITCCLCSPWMKPGQNQKAKGLGSSGRLRRC